MLGVSGVGKSHMARWIEQKMPGLLRLTASGLLRRSLRASGERLRKSPREIIEENQFRLASAIETERSRQADRPVLLEAHTFIDNDQELIEIPVDVLRKIGPSGILFLHAPPGDLFRRRNRDKRSRPLRSVDELEIQQNYALKLSKKYSSELGIPLRIINSDQKNEALDFLNNIMGETLKVRRNTNGK